MISAGLFVLLSVLAGTSVSQTRYDPTWESLDSRPLPDWYDEAKIGIFLHWGVYSVPCFGNEWFWWSWQGEQNPTYVNYMNQNYPPDFTYADFAASFNAKFYDPDAWADLFQAAGARYVVLTSKHHEGFTNWPSKYSFNWNALDVGPHRDLVGDLAAAIRNRTSIRFGLYHSLFEWFNPLYLEDKANAFATQNFVFSKAIPEMQEVINTYQPEIIWSDGDWEAPDTYWNSTSFLAWLYNDSPVKDTVVTNDRWGAGISCTHGGFYNCADRFNPGTLQPHKWENAMTIESQSWGYRCNSNSRDYLSMDTLVEQLIITISCGGNMLLNVGPTSDGMIAPIFQERLLQLGQWLGVNGEAIYASKPWRLQNDTLTPGVWYTSKDNVVYATFLDWPENNVLALGGPSVSDQSAISLLGSQEPISFEVTGENVVQVTLPSLNAVQLPTQWAWTLKLEEVQ